MAKEIYENDEYITLKGKDGEEINFIDIAGIALDSGYYAILQPVQLMDGMAEDEALVFKVEKLESGEDKFTIVVDDTVVDEVFAEYGRLIDEAEEQI